MTSSGSRVMVALRIAAPLARVFEAANRRDAGAAPGS